MPAPSTAVSSIWREGPTGRFLQLFRLFAGAKLIEKAMVQAQQ